MGSYFSSFLTRFFATQDSRIAMVGLDGAGKTTILYKLKFGSVITTIPTIGFNVETVKFQNLNMTVWDIGGQKSIRNLWKQYLDDNDAMIFCVDSSDKHRLYEVHEELWQLLDMKELEKSILLIFANKQDMPNAASVTEISEALELFKIRNRSWFIQSTDALSGDGLVDGLTWLAKRLRSKQK